MRLTILAFISLTILSGCYDTKERAQKYYESALSLFESGDDARAMLELRNVLQNDGMHFEGRKLYADTLLEQGNIDGAYSQYLRLIEQYPDTVEVRRLLAEFALDLGNWNEFERQSSAAIKLDPDLPEHQALGIMQTYHTAGQNSDDVAAAQAASDARALLEKNPELDTALRLLVDWNATGPEPSRALPYVERLLERHPKSQSLMMARLRALDAAGRDDDVGAALRELYDSYPENEQYSDMLLSWFVSRGDTASAERFLREKAGADDGPIERHAAVISLLQQTQGVSAALSELDRLKTANADTDLGRRYAGQAAALRFEAGIDRSTATMAMIVENMDDVGIKNDAEVVLINMYLALGNQKAATALTSEILNRDPFHVDALVIRALEKISANDLSGAVNDLRTALDQAPRDVRTLLILANAQQRLGNVELAEQRMAQAVEVSNAAPQAAIPYARFQIRRGNMSAAQRVLNDSLANALDIEVAALLAQVQLQLGDTAGARNLLARLVESKNPDATALIRGLQASILFSENRIDDSLVFLSNSLDDVGDDTNDLGTELQMLRIQLLSSRFDEARVQLDALRARFPDSVALLVIEANMLSLEGRLDESIALFRKVLEANPDQLIAIQRLYTLLQNTGDQDGASALLISSLEQQPESRPLVLLRALELEQEGEIDAALASYEMLYAKDPENLVVANNYASMLAYYTEDEDSLARAKTISGPLNGSNIPAFLDTLGYISMRQGALNDAVLNFEAAARALPDNATLAFNLATAYARTNRQSEAIAELERGFRLSEGSLKAPNFEDAIALYATLGSASDQ